jgi:predicted nucleotidyltransferase
MNPNLDFKDSLKRHVNSVLPGARVVLFGSRSRGNSRNDSDVDILVISDNEYKPQEKINLESAINKILVKAYHLPFDVLLYSSSEIERKKREKSLVIYHALQEGLELI